MRFGKENKNISKHQEEVLCISNSIPEFNLEEEIKGFTWIRFLATDYELEQQIFRQKNSRKYK